MMVLMAYCSCSRIGDIARVRRIDVSEVNGGNIITFRRSKVTMKRGAFSIPISTPPSAYATKLQDFIRRKRGFLFS